MLHPTFFTATCNHWLYLLREDECKSIIVNSLSFLVENNRVKVFGFVIMNNHMHIIWQVLGNYTREEVQRDFLKFTGQQIKFYLQKNNADLLEKCKVHDKDRQYQIWKRNALSIEIFSEKVMLQKLNYVHLNPVKAGLAELPEAYYYSSASYYQVQSTTFSFLSHFMG